MVLCFKLYFGSDGTTSNTASAAIRQGVAVVIDRMIEEDKKPASKIIVYVIVFILNRMGNYFLFFNNKKSMFL